MKFTKLKLPAAVLFVFLLSALAIEAQVCTPAPVGLVSWWSGDGNALDSRSRNNGMLQNGASFGMGHIGQAFDFDGIDDEVIITSSGIFRGQSGGTIEAWIRPEGAHSGGSGTVMYEDTGTAGLTRLGIFVFDDGRLRLFGRDVATGNASFRSVITEPGAIPLNTFTHVAGVWEAGVGIRLYINGVIVGQANDPMTAEFSNDSPLSTRVGSFETTDGSTSNRFNGMIDEIGTYSRALSEPEIAAIHAAGTAGKCKPTATVPPSGIVGWWSGDGSPDDISGNDNHAMMLNGAGFELSRVGQGFSLDGVDDAVMVGNNPILNVQTGNFTLEAWVNLRSFNPNWSFIAGKDRCGEGSVYSLFVSSIGEPRMRLNNSAGITFYAIAAAPITLDQWHHLVGVREGDTLRVFVDGIEAGVTPLSGTFGNQTHFFSIGERPNHPEPSCRALTDGLIDEVSLYNRALTPDEILSIFNSGIGGKLKTSDTPAGLAYTTKSDYSERLKHGKNLPYTAYISPEAVNISVGDVAVSFDTVTSAGITQQIPLSADGLPSLPVDPSDALIYDISTSAQYAGDIELCFNLPSFSGIAEFGGLQVLHLEDGVWENRTTTRDFSTRTVCAQTTSLSPFAIASLAPTSATASIVGRVATLGGRGLSNVSVTITGGNLDAPRRTLSNLFGIYRIDGLEAGKTYVVQVGSRRYTFIEPVRVIDLDESITEIDFFAVFP